MRFNIIPSPPSFPPLRKNPYYSPLTLPSLTLRSFSQTKIAATSQLSPSTTLPTNKPLPPSTSQLLFTISISSISSTRLDARSPSTPHFSLPKFLSLLNLPHRSSKKSSTIGSQNVTVCSILTAMPLNKRSPLRFSSYSAPSGLPCVPSLLLIAIPRSQSLQCQIKAT